MPSEQDVGTFSSDSCLQLSDAVSPSLPGSLDSPVDISSNSFDFFTDTFTTIDLQHLAAAAHSPFLPCFNKSASTAIKALREWRRGERVYIFIAHEGDLLLLSLPEALNSQHQAPYPQKERFLRASAETKATCTCCVAAAKPSTQQDPFVSLVLLHLHLCVSEIE